MLLYANCKDTGCPEFIDWIDAKGQLVAIFMTAKSITDI